MFLDDKIKLKLKMKPETKQTKKPEPTIPVKKKRKNINDLGPDFVAPDGGWGWAVCVATGFSYFCGMPVFQQFGLIFRDRLLNLGLVNTQITTLFNVNSAISSCSGLFIGPMYRVLTYRQLAVIGAVFMTVGLFLASFSDSFITYLLTFSILYGFGLGVNKASATLALYTYFKEKRRIAAGIQWTIIGIGPIVMPYIAAFLVPVFGVQGSVIIFSGIACHAAVCGMIYQPVLRHVKKPDKLREVEEQGLALNNICEYCKKPIRTNYICDDTKKPVINNTDPDSPMLARNSNGISPKVDQESNDTKQELNSSNHVNKERDDRCTCSAKTEPSLKDQNRNEVKPEETDPKKSRSLQQKIVAFFDLDLLKDFTCLNLIIGLTTANFAEMNYTLLTPFILRDYGFSQTDIANTMALLAVTDVSLRFVIPFIVNKVAWQNKTFFAVGVMAMAMGRIVVAHTRNYYVILVISAWIGLGKALRTVFMTLVVPSHVPLKRLSAAVGLELLIRGIFTLAVGPLVGKIRDASNYTVTLHCLNIATFWTILSWWLEDVYRKRKTKKERSGTNL